MVCLRKVLFGVKLLAVGVSICGEIVLALLSAFYRTNLCIANTVFGRSSYRKCFLDNRYGQETIYLPRPFTPRIAYRISLTTNHVGRVIMEKSHYILKA